MKKRLLSSPTLLGFVLLLGMSVLPHPSQATPVEDGATEASTAATAASTAAAASTLTGIAASDVTTATSTSGLLAMFTTDWMPSLLGKLGELNTSVRLQMAEQKKIINGDIQSVNDSEDRTFTHSSARDAIAATTMAAKSLNCATTLVGGAHAANASGGGSIKRGQEDVMVTQGAAGSGEGGGGDPTEQAHGVVNLHNANYDFLVSDTEDPVNSMNGDLPDKIPFK